MAFDRWEDYFYPGTRVLRNLEGITDPDALRDYEYEISTDVDASIRRGEITVARTFDGDHLRALHRELFGELYEWAGQNRTVGLSKDGIEFASPQLIDTYLADAARIIDGVPWETVDRDTFAEQTARVYAHINQAHFAREGNGRAGKLFLHQLSERTPYRLDFARIPKQVWDQRSALSGPDRGAHTPDHTLLVPVFAHITIDRPASPDPEQESPARRAARIARRGYPRPVTDITRDSNAGPRPTRRDTPRPGRDRGDYER
ncbi:Fic/DOC family protein [Williamsia sterculiae]|uniref:protein adenylyltransferase n=1 Tax=Williamsia sterculiae TaxID=1344003 RepID=A0A1N7HE68_9NOCA|nr:Fic family protein [Williamsia sterculiae]SIS23159.1 cell filamentation protein [Williamsia sterculiae]